MSTSITITERIQEDTSVIERAAKVETTNDELCQMDIAIISKRLVEVLSKTRWNAISE